MKKEIENMRKTRVALWSLMLAILMASAGFGLSQDEPQEPVVEEPVEIKWITSPVSSEALNEFYTEGIAQFESEHPNITVNWIKLKEADNRTTQMLIAGAGPDIISVTPTQFKKFAEAGYLLDMSQYAEKYNWQDRYFDWAYGLFQYNGKLMGVPTLIEGLLVYYNKDLFDKYAWEVPQTYEDLMTLCGKMQAEDIIPFAFGTSDYKAANEWWISAAVNAAIPRAAMKDYLQVQKPWNSDQMTEAMTKLKDLWQQGCINARKSFSIPLNAAWTLFYQGEAAMKMTGTWGTKSIMGADPNFEWGTFLIPSFSEQTEPSIPIGISAGLGINAASEHPDATAAFIDFLHSEAMVKKQLKFGDYYPIEGIDVSTVEGVDPKIVETYKTIMDAFESGSAGYVSWTYWPPSTRNYMWQEFDSLVLEQVSLEEYMDSAQEAALNDKEEGLLVLSE